MDENPYRSSLADGSNPPQPKSRVRSVAFMLLLALGIIGLAICFLLPAVRTARPAAYRNHCVNNLKQIALALKSYSDTYHALPPTYTVDADGKPLHSWRTLILPYLEQPRLYESIDLTKAWDDPANAEALKARPFVFQCPSAIDQENHTTYLAVLTPSSCFRPTEPRTLSDITDGTRETMMLIEVDSDHAVPWMAPMDADEALYAS